MAEEPERRLLLLLAPLLIGACTLSLLGTPSAGPTGTPSTAASSPTRNSQTATIESTTGTQPADETGLPPVLASPATFCDDPRPRALIDTLKEAVSSEDGALLAAIISPVHGMDARLLRDGRVVNYDRQHAAALFGSTYVVDWGIAPASGLPIKGSFRDLFVPDLNDVFSKAYAVKCNQIQSGGSTYSIRWPYDGIDFYSLFFSGTAKNGQMDWHTWVLGMHMVAQQPYLYAIMQFKWEP
ncbi:MAG TPA: hypothetical protein VFH29_04615 [Anaerolineales bacterium]|nr:hypothetical protein [Anaerolineales bacterium]